MKQLSLLCLLLFAACGSDPPLTVGQAVQQLEHHACLRIDACGRGGETGFTSEAQCESGLVGQDCSLTSCAADSMVTQAEIDPCLSAIDTYPCASILGGSPLRVYYPTNCELLH
jgi:hypothetical protein